MLPGEQKFLKEIADAQLKAYKGDDGVFYVEGWTSTRDLDSGNDIVEPEAFRDILPQFMENPILLFNHDLNQVLGKTISAEIRDNGLWTKDMLLPTSLGADIILLIQAGVIKKKSFSFSIKESITDEETGIRRITKIKRLFETSIVALPMNDRAIIEAAKSKQLILKSFNMSLQGGGSKGRKNMDPNEIKSIVEDSLKPVETTVKEMGGQIGKIVSLEKQLKEFGDSAKRTEAEQSGLIEKMSNDFKNAITEFKEAQKTIAENRINYGTQNRPIIGHQKMIDLPSVELKAMHTPEMFASIDKFRQLSDQLFLMDNWAASLTPERSSQKFKCYYAALPREERIKKLNIYPQFEAARKAMDTSTSNEGSQYLPAGYSSRLVDMIRLENIIPNLHPTFPMPQASVVLPVEGADTLATRATQTTTYVAAFNSTEQTPGSANVTFTAEKLRARIQLSAEADQDLIIAMFPYVEMKAARSIVRALENAIINGDDAGGGGFDTGDVPGATDSRYCWNGYRGLVQTGAKVDMSSWSESNIVDLLATMGKYARRPSDNFFLTSIKAYLKHCLNPSEMPNYTSLDKYGAAATVLNGELGKILGRPIFISEYCLETLNAAGVYDGAGNTKTVLICVNRDALMLGVWLNATMEVVRDAINDVYDVVSYWRGDFKPLFTYTTNYIVGVGYGVTTA